MAPLLWEIIVGILEVPLVLMLADINCGTLISNLSFTLEFGATITLGSLGRATLIGGKGFIGRFNVVGSITVLTLEIGIVGRLMVVGIPFATFRICPL